MKSITSLLSEPAEAKLYLQWYQEFESAVLDYEYEISQIQVKRTRLVNTHELSQRAIYPFKVLP